MPQKKDTNNLINITAFILLAALFIFLPLSSWLVSVLGSPWISTVRDALVLLLLLLVILNRKINKNKLTLLASVFIMYGFLSFLWREASLLQWLRGFRFTFIPIVLFISISSLELDRTKKRNLLVVVLAGGLIITAVSIIEALGIKIPLTSRLSGGLGLEAAQYLEGTQVKRLQSLLAGPNALGLYLMALIAYGLGSFKLISKKAIWLMPILCIILFLTFSRSSLLGLLIILLSAGFVYSKKKFGVVRTYGWSASLLLLLFLMIFFRSERFDKFITHGTSSKLRYEQVVRVWEERGDISILGRGSGTAGPSSQNRIDQGPNRWSENIFLETFEELGLIGLTLLVLLYIMLVKKGWSSYNTEIGKTAFLITIGFSLSGLFINNYTGQAGIYLFFLANGLANSPVPKNTDG